MADNDNLIAQARAMYERIAENSESWPRDELAAALLVALADALEAAMLALDNDEPELRIALEAAEAENRRLREALGEIDYVVGIRSTGVRMDGTTEFPTPMHAQVYEIVRAALAGSGDE